MLKQVVDLIAHGMVWKVTVWVSGKENVWVARGGGRRGPRFPTADISHCLVNVP